MQQLLETTKPLNFLAIGYQLAQEFAKTAAERDQLRCAEGERNGGNRPIHEIEQLRQSGLLNLVIPTIYGGLGETSWVKIFGLIREFAKADGSIGQLFGNHTTIISSLSISNPTQVEQLYLDTVQHNWFWANAANALDPRLLATPTKHGWQFDGIKRFATGASLSDRMIVSALSADSKQPVIAIIPSDRPGIHFNGNWDNMGQRQTDSGSVTFEQVLVTPDEILTSIYPSDSPIATLINVFKQLNQVNIYLGIVQGAFATARDYTTTRTRPWITSGVEQAIQDPYILHHYGEFWMELEAATLLTDRAAQVLQAAIEKGINLTAQQRGEAAIAVYTAKAFVTKIGLAITTQMFDAMGASATAQSYNFDRYWRNLRTATLHDPVDYKIREVGNWALTGTVPTITPYS
ncbi:acyl-CoA dehydrogenase family protein [Desmonostoc muscorum LEGE 12446]|uniref:Dibenzothiophene monooxygenase n=1 Tax=Desmonostoc muscorum LEGE 12446 TaxID=1828758 RepID=A0A8J6ZT80_DESMC|nr:acyl-CoA dehydrogenase family protein [Desmonostoc muscorum]MCF2151423.1 acyl-CoA dehydrogenase family protein [Desmonostoc muscorum LEGE 12446]